ncbi:MAG: hypothetical protein ACJ764_15440, partial [Solirubrobacteraceae bacterium]
RRPWTDQSVPVEDETREEAPDPAPMAAAQRYAVKWIDRSDGRPMPRQERDLTFTQALDEVRRVSRDTQSVGGLPASAFSGLRVYLQCFCGRDVADPSKPHIAPLDGRLCPYSGSRQTTEPSPVAPSREEQTAPLRAVAA